MNNRAPEPEVWIARLRTFVHDCTTSRPCEEADRVREAAALLHSGAAAGAIANDVDCALVEAMLDCGAVESAIMAMLDPQTGFMLSRGQGHLQLATVVMGDDLRETTCEGATLALALLAAYSTSLLTGLERDRKGSCNSLCQAFGRLQ